MSQEKIDGVLDCAKWLENKCKIQKERVVSAEKDYQGFGMFDDCGESYRESLLTEKARLQTMVDTKISFEKYAKKLKHEMNET